MKKYFSKNEIDKVFLSNSFNRYKYFIHNCYSVYFYLLEKNGSPVFLENGELLPCWSHLEYIEKYIRNDEYQIKKIAIRHFYNNILDPLNTYRIAVFPNHQDYYSVDIPKLRNDLFQELESWGYKYKKP